jgi:hydroxymethylbilane synthase
VKLRLGTRGSRLARAQAEIARTVLIARRPGLEIELVIVKTEGAARRDAPIAALGTGAFTKELEDALLAGRCDLAVHSLKDLPTTLAPGLVLAAVLPRADVRDAVCARGRASLHELGKGARVGTSSPRRRGQILALRSDLVFLPLRGNVETRLSRLELPEKDPKALDACVLAMAGLERLSRAHGLARPLEPEMVLPAAGQGAIALEARVDDARTREIALSVDDHPTHQATLAERLLHLALGGGCRAPIGALGRVEGGELRLEACVAALDGSQVVRGKRTGKDPGEVALALARELRARGAEEILSNVRIGLEPGDEVGP